MADRKERDRLRYETKIKPQREQDLRNRTLVSEQSTEILHLQAEKAFLEKQVDDLLVRNNALIEHILALSASSSANL